MDFSFLEDLKISVLATGGIDIKGEIPSQWKIDRSLSDEGFTKLLFVSIRKNDDGKQFVRNIPFILELRPMSGVGQWESEFEDGTVSVRVPRLRGYDGRFIQSS